MAREATARLYDVDADTIAFKRFNKSGKHDIETVTFRAKPRKLIDLDRLHESVWATRLSGGTSSGLVSLEVTVAGTIVVGEKEMTLKVADAEPEFVLAQNPEADFKNVFDELNAALERGDKVTSVTGRLDGWSGRWPEMLKKLPPKPRRILVTRIDVAKE
ncbi:MAG: hypothetical protein ACKV2Q_17895 [Planctomycetaceae bacterium]